MGSKDYDSNPFFIEKSSPNAWLHYEITQGVSCYLQGWYRPTSASCGKPEKEKYSCAEHPCCTKSAFQAASLPFHLLVDRFSTVSGDMFQPHTNKLALCMYILVLNLTLIRSLILLHSFLQILMSSPFLIYSPVELLFEEIGKEILFWKSTGTKNLSEQHYGNTVLLDNVLSYSNRAKDCSTRMSVCTGLHLDLKVIEIC